MLQGQNPSVQSALDIYHILTESNTDLRQPVGLESQLLKESSMDNEVGRSMLQLLTVCTLPESRLLLGHMSTVFFSNIDSPGCETAV